MFFDLTHKATGSPFNIGLGIAGNPPAAVKTFLAGQLRLLAKDAGEDKNNMQELSFEKIFTDAEFNQKVPEENEESFINKHFYPALFAGIKRSENGGIAFQVHYCFTLDSSLTPERSASGIYYGTLCLGARPVLYYIRVDVQEIIQLVKSVQAGDE